MQSRDKELAAVIPAAAVMPHAFPKRRM